MKITSDENNARVFRPYTGEAWNAAIEWMERDENNPHITGLWAIPELDVSGSHVRVGVFNANGVRVGLLCAITTLALLSGCTRYGIKACSAFPHTHLGAPDVPSVYGDPALVPCDTDTDCERKNGGQY